jgi:GAF domain-containing protein
MGSELPTSPNLNTVAMTAFTSSIKTGQPMQMNDSYFTSKHPKSMLCLPILHQGKVTGVLYLENDLTSDAFTVNRLETLQLLSAQAAASIENALLYTFLQKQNKQLEEYSKTLSERVDERTAELTDKNNQLQQEIKERQEAETKLQRAKEIAEAATLEKSRVLFLVGEIIS